MDAREIFVVREDDRVFGYVNSCPHLGTPLNWAGDTFISEDSGLIICATHGALFEIEDGARRTPPAVRRAIAEAARHIRRIAALEGRYVGILVDLPGPKVRAASFGTEPVVLVEDSRLELRVGNQRSDASNIEVDYEGLLSDVGPGDRLSMGDGRVILEILEIQEHGSLKMWKKQL